MGTIAADLPPVVGRQIDRSKEQYAASLATLEWLGYLALGGPESTGERSGVEAMARADFKTALGEGLGSDSELRLHLKLQPMHEFAKDEDGYVLAADGRRMIDLIREGWQRSTAAAQGSEETAPDPRMWTQANRDWNDLLNAHSVDKLQPGQYRLVLSRYPAEAMARDGSKYWEDKGYRRGLDYLQAYYMHPDGKLRAASYAVTGGDTDTWRTVFAGHSVEVPAGTPADNWIRYVIERSLPPEEAAVFGDRIRDAHYALTHQPIQRYSVDDILQQHQETVDAYFAGYILPLAESIVLGRPHQALQELAAAMLNSPDTIAKLNAGDRKELIRVAAGAVFGPASGRLIDKIVRYAAVEQIRAHIVRLLGNVQMGAPLPSLPAYHPPAHGVLPEQIVQHVSMGLAACRSHAGCAASLQSLDHLASEAGEGINPQGIFGGKEQGKAADVPNLIRCINCRRLATKEQVIQPKSWKCPHCAHEVDICTGVTIHRGRLLQPQPIESLLSALRQHQHPAHRLGMEWDGQKRGRRPERSIARIGKQALAKAA